MILASSLSCVKKRQAQVLKLVKMLGQEKEGGDLLAPDMHS
jgi:hypothetical protein